MLQTMTIQPPCSVAEINDNSAAVAARTGASRSTISSSTLLGGRLDAIVQADGSRGAAATSFFGLDAGSSGSASASGAVGSGSAAAITGEIAVGSSGPAATTSRGPGGGDDGPAASPDPEDGKKDKKKKKKREKKHKRRSPSGPDDGDGSSSSSSSSSSEESRAARRRARRKARDPVGDPVFARRTENEKLTFLAMPESSLGFPGWWSQVRTEVTAASQRGDVCFDWIRKIEDPESTFDAFGDSGLMFQSMDAKIMAALTRLLKGELNRRI
jgi:hypothetical protein